MPERFIDSFINDVILGEHDYENAAVDYYKRKIKNPEFAWLKDKLRERKAAFDAIDENDPEYIAAKNEALKNIPTGDTFVWVDAVKEFKLKWLAQKEKEQEEASKKSK